MPDEVVSVEIETPNLVVQCPDCGKEFDLTGTLPCPNCGEYFPVFQYRKHIEECLRASDDKMLQAIANHREEEDIA